MSFLQCPVGYPDRPYSWREVLHKGMGITAMGSLEAGYPQGTARLGILKLSCY